MARRGRQKQLATGVFSPTLSSDVDDNETVLSKTILVFFHGVFPG